MPLKKHFSTSIVKAVLVLIVTFANRKVLHTTDCFWKNWSFVQHGSQYAQTPQVLASGTVMSKNAEPVGSFQRLINEHKARAYAYLRGA